MSLLKNTRIAATICLGLLSLTACSVGMEASRPEPVDISQFKAGMPRLDVVSKIGAPEGDVTAATGPCDVYQLYTTGLGAFGKGVVTGTEVLTDIGTLGLAEIIWSPAQAMTKQEKRTVLFCYDGAGDLVSMTVNGNQRVGALPTSVPVAPAAAPVTGAAPITTSVSLVPAATSAPVTAVTDTPAAAEAALRGSAAVPATTKNPS
jgi:hypothetical protein